jgi:hypothetical protein
LKLQIEQQRFLNFGLEAGILYSDPSICANLQINRSLLVGVLAEIRLLFQQHAEKYGRYESMLSQSEQRATAALSGNVMDLLGISFEDSHGNHSLGKSKKVYSLGRKFLQAGKNLRTIAIEPKRLVWAVFDKDNFEHFLNKLNELNSFLIALLDGAQVNRLQEAMNTSYLEILQIRNDLESIKGLVQALSPGPRSHVRFDDEFSAFRRSPLAQTLQEEREKEETNKRYLARLAKIKMQHTRMAQLGYEQRLNFSDMDSIGIELDFRLIKFDTDSLAKDWDNGIDRNSAAYQNKEVWIEWKEIPNIVQGTSAQPTQVENRIRLLTDLLSSEKPEKFRAHSCLGYVKVAPKDDEQFIGYGIRFGIVFQKPPSPFQTSSKMTTLRNLLEAQFKPSFSARTALCATLASCILSFHDVNWLHKGLRSDNILFYVPGGSQQNDWQHYQYTVLNAPYVSGFELSRPSSAVGMSEGPESNAARDIYRHPCAQSVLSPQRHPNTDVYRKSYDIYSLGLMFLEIALWQPLDTLIGVQNVHQLSAMQLRNVKSMFLENFGIDKAQNTQKQGLEVHRGNVLLSPPAPSRYSETAKIESTKIEKIARKLSEECGDVFYEVIERCFRADEMDSLDHNDESTSLTGVTLRRMMENEVVQKLQRMSTAMRV